MEDAGSTLSLLQTQPPVEPQDAAPAEAAPQGQEAPADGAPDAGGGLMEQAGNALSDPASFFEQNSALLTDYAVRIAGVLVLLFVGYLIARWVGSVTSKALTRAKIDLTLAKFFGRMARWGVLILVVISVLGIFGINTASFAVVLGAAGLAIGLAFQGTLSNFAAGVMLLVFRPFKIGQFVNVAGVMGTVDEIDLFNTTLDTPDNRRLILPNSSIFGSTIENFSHHPRRRVDVPVGVEYAADIDKTREALEKAVTTIEGRLEDPPHQILLDALADSSVNWIVRVWAPSSDFFPVRERTIRAIKMHLEEAGLGIPFPQMDVHLDGQIRTATSE